MYSNAPKGFGKTPRGGVAASCHRRTMGIWTNYGHEKRERKGNKWRLKHKYCITYNFRHGCSLGLNGKRDLKKKDFNKKKRTNKFEQRLFFYTTVPPKPSWFHCQNIKLLVVDWHLVRWLHIHLTVKATGSNPRPFSNTQDWVGYCSRNARHEKHLGNLNG